MEKKHAKTDKLHKNDTAPQDSYVGVYGEGSAKWSPYTRKDGSVAKRATAYVYASDRKKIYGNSKKSLKEALEQAKKKRDLYDRSLDLITPADLTNPYLGKTFAEFAQKIISGKKALDDSSVDKYTDYLTWLTAPEFEIESQSGRNFAIGKLQMKDVMIYHLEPFIENLLEARAKSTVKRFRAWCVSLFRKAVNFGVRPDNPARELDSIHVPPMPPVSVTRETFETLMEHCTCPRMRAAICLLGHGLRFSEIFGLAWSQFDGNRAQIAHQFKRIKSPFGPQEPAKRVPSLAPRKSNGLTYNIQLRDDEMRVIMDSLEASKPQMIPVGHRRKGKWSGEQRSDVRLVVPGPNGGVSPETSFRRELNNLIAKAGIDHLKPHDCRAWVATELSRNGASITAIQQALGHSQMQTTMGYIRPGEGAGVDAHVRISQLRLGTETM